MKRLKWFIVWSLETLCDLIDRAIRILPKPIRHKVPYGCQLASLSADLDWNWKTGHWKSVDSD